MKISNITMKKINNESYVKAMVTVTFDNCIVARDIKIISSSTNMFVVMPAIKMKDGTYKDLCHPTNKEYKEYLDNAIMNLYYSEKEEINFEVEQNIPVIKAVIRNVNAGTIKTIYNDNVIGFISATFDDCFTIHNIKVILTDNNKIDFDFPYRVTISGKEIYICQLINNEKEYCHQLFEIVKKEIEEGRMIISPNNEISKSEDVDNDRINKPKVIASAFYPETMRMVIDNIKTGKDVNEKDSILKIILESSNRFEEIGNRVIMYFNNDAKIIYHFENNKLQSAVGTLEDGHNYMFERNLVEERFLKEKELNAENKTQNENAMIRKTSQELFEESIKMLKAKLDESDT